MKSILRKIGLSFIVFGFSKYVAAEGAGKADGQSHRLRLEVVRTLPVPVIGKDTPGAETIPGGFEGGSSVKVMVDGKPEYHFFSHGYPKLDWSQSRLEHWMSSDGVNFRRVGVLLENYRDEKAGMNHIFCAPIPFYDDKSERWHLVFCEFVGPSTWTGDSGIIWCAESKTPGMTGISGPYDFANRHVLVSKECPKIGTATPVATSSSAPFKVKDGRWAVFVSTDYFIKDEKTGARKQQWPVMLNFAASPLGPFKPPQEAVVPPLIDPTGFIENPMPLKVRGPKSGRDYWVTVFDFLAPEVTPYTPKNVFGFSWSADGVHWPAENGQAVNIDDGLADGERGWWRGAWAVRTPHQMIDEGDGTYTIYFTGGSADNFFSAFRAVGKVTVRVIEEETVAKAPVSIDADKVSHAVPIERMRQVYDEVKTPFKYGVVIRGEANQLVDSPSVFRKDGQWYMVYVTFTGNVGYETCLARSTDLLHWEKLGKILSFRPDGWDRRQRAGYIALSDPIWGGSNELETYDGKYWMSYLGGALQGYETDPLAIGIAWTKTPTEAREWTPIAENPALTREQPDVRPFEKVTLYKSNIVWDQARTLGSPFVMFYNGKIKHSYEKIGMAVSDDMIHWKRFGADAVVANGEDKQHGISGDPQVVRMGDLWVMFYFGAFWRSGAFDTFACSTDLIHWSKWTGPDLVQSSEPWDKTYAHKPWVVKHDGVVYHFYCAVGDQGRVIALATSKDLRDESKRRNKP